MRSLLGLLLLVAFLGVQFLAAADQPSKPADPAKHVAFALKSSDGKQVALSDYKSKMAVAVVFIGTECPLVNLYVHRMKELHKEFADQGVQFVAINSNPQDSAEQIADHAKTHALPFPVLIDGNQEAMKTFGAERTPEAFVVNPQGVVQYRGRIDDQFGIGYQRSEPTERYLADALTAVISGKPVVKNRTEVQGCLITHVADAKKNATVTFNKDVMAILQNRCQECHRPGQIGPFSLLNYKQAKGWSAMMAETVKDRRMPPWHADPNHGKFANDRSLPAKERDVLMAWVEQGCPEGDAKDLPQAKTFTTGDGWTIGKPDAVLTMAEEFTIPAKAPEGGVPYQHFMVQTNFDEDKWIQSAEAKPGNRSVVHHIVVFVLPPGEGRGRGQEDGIGNNFLVGTAPGDMPMILPPGHAKRIPKGSNLVFQMHYTPNGIEQKDRSSMGLIFAKEPPEHPVRTRTVMNRRFAIPPGAESHRVFSQSTFAKDAVILTFMPHMHLRGKDFEYKVVYPDKTEEILLSVPKYDFGWQTMYRLAEPKRIPAGSRMECVAHYDNSTKNLNNPDATRTVYWGDQTWEEMMIGWTDYYFVDEGPGTKKTTASN